MAKLNLFSFGMILNFIASGKRRARGAWRRARGAGRSKPGRAESLPGLPYYHHKKFD